MIKLTIKQLKTTAFYLACSGLYFMAAIPLIKSDGIVGAITTGILYYCAYFMGNGKI